MEPLEEPGWGWTLKDKASGRDLSSHKWRKLSKMVFKQIVFFFFLTQQQAPGSWVEIFSLLVIGSGCLLKSLGPCYSRKKRRKQEGKGKGEGEGAYVWVQKHLASNSQWACTFLWMATAVLHGLDIYFFSSLRFNWHIMLVSSVPRNNSINFWFSQWCLEDIKFSILMKFHLSLFLFHASVFYILSKDTLFPPMLQSFSPPSPLYIT